MTIYRVHVKFDWQKRNFDFDDSRDALGFLKDVLLKMTDMEYGDEAHMTIINVEEDKAE